jgi:F-type H+-transporting ATPase subunit a
MIAEQTPLTELLNRTLGPALAHALQGLGIPSNPAAAFSEAFVMSAVVVLLGMLLVMLLKPQISVDRPGALQQVCEILLTNPTKFGIRDLLDEHAGHHGRKHLAMVGSIAIFILLGNLLGIFPLFSTPTANPSVPLACAILTFLYFNLQGFRAHGVAGYLKHFAGPNPFLAPLLFPVEIISTSARVLSLTVRLYANMFASELVYLVFLGLLVGPVASVWHKFPPVAIVLAIFPATIPILFIGLHIFVAVLQTMVFTILPSIYLGMATAHEH